MKSKVIASVVIASLLGPSAAVFAQPRPVEPYGHAAAAHGPAHGPAHGSPAMRGPAHAAPRHAAPPPHDAAMGRMGGPIPHNDWRRGDRLPSAYRDRNYVVDDWRGHGLSAPPRGYHWVGVNGDYVLAAVATGVIMSIFVSGR
ncbi:MAG TPA: RcnB family protein [Paraburkholderia sp.]|nr:RcnB family protein [Paraburkholderia sp.]